MRRFTSLFARFSFIYPMFDLSALGGKRVLLSGVSYLGIYLPQNRCSVELLDCDGGTASYGC